MQMHVVSYAICARARTTNLQHGVALKLESDWNWKRKNNMSALKAHLQFWQDFGLSDFHVGTTHTQPCKNLNSFRFFLPFLSSESWIVWHQPSPRDKMNPKCLDENSWKRAKNSRELPARKCDNKCLH